jgi:NADH-quinone oxidoreductase subunit M
MVNFDFIEFTYSYFNYILPIICFLPLLLIILIFFIPETDYKNLRNFSLTGTCFIFFFTLILYFSFNPNSTVMQFVSKIIWINQFNFFFSYGLDGISIFFVLLTALLIPICIICSWESIKLRFKDFVILLLFVETLLFHVFSITDLFWFYIFFESSLIPMFIIIGVWGSRTRRIHAAYQFFLYTFAGSLLMLISIMFIYANFGSTDYFFLLRIQFSSQFQLFFWLAFFASFSVKIPMLPVHIWLPEAHVEAPTAGSVLLAGILLKLGTYGFLRFSIPFFPVASEFFTPFVYLLSIIGIVYSSCTTLRQIDLKKIIAYTSVAHMNLVTIGIFSQNIYGIEGAISLMLSHGLVSSGLFLCVGLLYDRYHTRLLNYYGGVVNFMPFFSFVFVVLSLSNMGFPGTSAFVGEFLILLGAFVNNTLVAFLASTSVIFSAAYSMWLCNRLLFGPIKNFIKIYSDLNFRELFLLFFLIIMVFFYGIFPNFILNNVHFGVTNVILATQDWPIFESPRVELSQDEIDEIWGPAFSWYKPKSLCL